MCPFISCVAVLLPHPVGCTSVFASKSEVPFVGPFGCKESFVAHSIHAAYLDSKARRLRSFSHSTTNLVRSAHSNLMAKEMEPGDFHVAVKRREFTDTPWRWEILAAGKTRAVA